MIIGIIVIAVLAVVIVGIYVVAERLFSYIEEQESIEEENNG